MTTRSPPFDRFTRDASSRLRHVEREPNPSLYQPGGGTRAAGVLVVAKAYNHETEGYSMPDDDDPEADESDAAYLENP